MVSSKCQAPDDSAAVYEEFRMSLLPLFERLDGSHVIEGFLRQLLVVEPDVAVERGAQIFN